MTRWIVVGPICLAFATVAVAEDKHRQLGAHEHGHGSFNIAIEGKRVSMELEAPGADIVGFEHKARTKEQRAAVSTAKETLKQIANVVGLPSAAGCKLQKASVELHIEGEDHHEHKHAEKGKAKSHGSKEGADEGSHSEFHAEYQLTCAAPERLVEITFPYFENFKGAEELEVSVAGPKSQKKFEVERDASKINLGGLI